MTLRDTPHRLVPARLPTSAPTPFRLTPDPEQTEALARELGLLDLRKLRFEGEIRPQGKHDWHLTATLGATAVQPCSVTLQPVTTRIDAPVERLYLADFRAPSETEAEMPEDDSVEPLPAVIDLREVMAEALALELPDYPRAPDAEPGDATFTPPGAAPLQDEELKPFAGLAALKKQLED